MAIGSQGEIGKQFLTGGEIHYPWIVDGVRHQLMHGDSRIAFVKGRRGNIYPPDHLEWEYTSKFPHEPAYGEIDG